MAPRRNGERAVGRKSRRALDRQFKLVATAPDLSRAVNVTWLYRVRCYRFRWWSKGASSQDTAWETTLLLEIATRIIRLKSGADLTIWHAVSRARRDFRPTGSFALLFHACNVQASNLKPRQSKVKGRVF